MTEDQLQESIERGENHVSRDGRAYRIVFNALRREPGFVLPPSFADRVVSQLVEKRSSRDMFWLFMGLVGLLIALVVSVALTGFKPDLSFLSVGTFTFLASYKGLVFFGLAFILVLQWIDRKFVQKDA